MTSVNSLCFSPFCFLRALFRSLFCLYFALGSITNVVSTLVKHSFFASHFKKVENHHLHVSVPQHAMFLTATRLLPIRLLRMRSLKHKDFENQS